MRAPVVAVLLLLFSTACADASSRPVSGGDGCGDDGTRDALDAGAASPAADAGSADALPAGGYLELARFTSGGETDLLALAELDSGHSGPGRLPSTFYLSFPLDSCFQVPLLPEEPSAWDFVDVGAAIRLEGPAVIELERESLLGNIFYRARPSDIAPGDYAASLGATLRMPPAPHVVEPDLAAGAVVFGADPITLSWEPVGADHLFAIFQQDSMGRICHLADDGAFELPADAAAGTPVWGSLVFLALNIDVAELDGRAVELLGVQGQVADYERP